MKISNWSGFQDFLCLDIARNFGFFWMALRHNVYMNALGVCKLKQTLKKTYDLIYTIF